MHPLSIFKKSDSRIEAFMNVVEQHKEFFVKCPQIDSFLVGMAFDYLQRTKPSIAPAQYSPNLLFCCLYLAWVSFYYCNNYYTPTPILILMNRKLKKIQQSELKALSTMLLVAILHHETQRTQYSVNMKFMSGERDYGSSMQVNISSFYLFYFFLCFSGSNGLRLSIGKDLLWKALDFNTYVDHNTVNSILTLFPDESVYRRQRQDQELVKYF